MNADALFYLLLFISIVYFVFEFILDELNFKHSLLPLPSKIAAIYTTEAYHKSKEYKITKHRFNKWESVIMFLVSIVFFYFKGYGLLDKWIRLYISNEMGVTICFFVIIAFVSDILSIPFTYYDLFVIEEKFGFNKTTHKTFFIDKLKSYFLMALLGIPVIYIITYFYLSYAENFWWIAFLLVALVSLVANLIYIPVIVPLFNQLSPIQEGSLKEKINTYVQQNSFNLKKIMVIDGSKRSTKANAYFTGFGKTKTVVLFDTLLEKLTEEETVAVLAHEIGHYKKGHIYKSLLLGVITTGLSFWLFSYFLGNQTFDIALGGTKSTLHLEIIAISIIFSPLNFVVNFISNRFSQANEFEADAFAKQTYNGMALCSALIKLSQDSLSVLNPHPLYVKLFYSHPPLHQRLEALGYFAEEKTLTK